jgi:hypothetical protein
MTLGNESDRSMRGKSFASLSRKRLLRDPEFCCSTLRSINWIDRMCELRVRQFCERRKLSLPSSSRRVTLRA